MVCGNSFRDKEPRTEDTKIQRKNTKEEERRKKAITNKRLIFVDVFDFFLICFLSLVLDSLYFSLDLGSSVLGS